jgi:signal transduction histidine kinase/CheY-like chemotaxis protein
MIDFVRAVFLSDEFMPHGHCYLWKPGLLSLHVGSDGLIGTAYLVIAVTLWRLVARARIPFSPMVLAFGLFIGACGLTHYMEIFTVWVPDYWLAGGVKAVTAVASVATGGYLFRTRPAIVGVAQAAALAEERRLQLEAAHRKLEAAARRHERALRTMRECNEALVRATDEQALLDAVCRIIVEAGEYRMSWVGFAENDPRKTIRPVAFAGHEDGYLALVDSVWADAERGRGPSGTAVRTRRPVIVHDVARDAGFDPWRSEAVRRGYRSLVALPLVAGGATFGVLRVYAGVVDAFDDDEVKLLVDLADDLAFGIASLRARSDRDRMTAQLVQADRMISVGTLAAGVAHEINNPLAYLIAALDFVGTELKGIERLAPGWRWDEVNGALAEAREGAARVRHVVRDLKTFSRGDEERRGRTEVRPVLESSINMAFNEIRYRARLVKDYGTIPAVLANEARLGQVFLNLLINAAQAIPEGHVDRNEIRVVTRTDELGRAVVGVHDSGAGIPADHLTRIFDPFFTTKPPGVGTGLGLSICSNIVKSLGGDLFAESQVGKGSVFRVALPPAPTPAEEVPPVPPPLAGRRGRVLVVDDEPAIAEGISRLLRSEHDVVTLTSAREARDLIAGGERFDVIISDLMMPGMTGMELHAALLSLAPEQAERMVVLTGGAFTSSARQFLDAVPNLRVEKPMDAVNLRAIVRGLVR